MKKSLRGLTNTGRSAAERMTLLKQIGIGPSKSFGQIGSGKRGKRKRPPLLTDDIDRRKRLSHSLFVTQSSDRVDSHGAAGGQIARKKRDE